MRPKVDTSFDQWHAVASVVALGFSTLYAFWLQGPFPDVDHEPVFPSLDWWRYPIENNPSKRLPDFLNKDLLAVYFSDPRHGKVVTADGIEFITENAGATWKAGGIICEHTRINDELGLGTRNEMPPLQ